MRRIILFIILGVLVVFAFTRLFSRPKPQATAGTRKKSSDTLAIRTRKGKTAGQIKTKTKEELREERRRAQREERARRRELRRRQRELERMRRLSRRKRRIRSRRATQIYVLRAIMKIDSEKYALIDSRRMGIGEEISGRRIVEIGDDRIVIEEFGRRREVRIGESILPSVLTQKRRR